jgi:Holliday junction resolvasome RuvABC endonuclease subunit
MFWLHEFDYCVCSCFGHDSPSPKRRKDRIFANPKTKAVICQHTFGIPADTKLLRAICDEHKPAVICIEHYTLGSNSPGTADRIEYGGLLRYVLVSSGWGLFEVNQSTLKKWATGKGKFPPNSGKTPMIVSLTTRYKVELATDDEYDAYALARVAMQLAKFEQPTNQAQRECIESITTVKVKKPRKKVAA